MTFTALILGGVVFWLAYSNGANDNFKGVATLWGSHAATFRTALNWSTLTTVAGCLCSVFLAMELAQKFAGKNLIPAELMGTPELAMSAGGAAAATILLATFLGMPTSTTHALVGGLIGSVLVATGSVDLAASAQSFFIPLAVSPILAVGLALLIYPPLRWGRKRLGITRQTCVCIGQAAPQPVLAIEGRVAQLASTCADCPPVKMTLGENDTCVERYHGQMIGVDVQHAINGVHYLSAGAVCFARGLNDTPKIAALLLATGATFNTWTVLLVTVAMAAGGLLQSRRVADTMAHRITDLNPGQGLTANLITAALVLGASKIGVPVSTTHVSCGTIFGIGAADRSVKWKTVRQIGLAWITTLPMGLVLGAILYALFAL